MTDDEKREMRMHWSIYYGSVHSLQHHPGQNRENASPMTAAQSAEEADRMLDQLLQRMKDGRL